MSKPLPAARDAQDHGTLLATPLKTSIVGSRVLLYDTVESTNDRAFHVGGEGTVIVADSQTAGRGRHGRAWNSQPGLGIWCSVAFESDIEGLAFAAPLAVRDALHPHCVATIKWPNDVLIGGKKCCGILVESRRGITVLGIGINVCHRIEDFPEELRERATSVQAATGRPCHRAELLRDILTELDHRVIVLKEGGVIAIREEWAEACAIIGRHVRCGGHAGLVQEVAPDGGLVLRTEIGPLRVHLGEILEIDGA